LSKAMVKSIQEIWETVSEEKYVPWVIEPAFGIGRILYSVLEHNFHLRDEKRTYFSFPPKISPIKCSLLPVIAHAKFSLVIKELSNIFHA